MNLVRGFLAQRHLPAVRRLAFGAGLLHTEPSRIEAYHRLQAYLPIMQLAIPAETTDLSSKSTDGEPRCMPPLRINRLRKWAVVVLQFVALPVEAGRLEMSYHLRLELDINTEERAEALQPNLLAPLLSELWDRGLEIASEGEAL